MVGTVLLPQLVDPSAVFALCTFTINDNALIETGP